MQRNNESGTRTCLLEEKRNWLISSNGLTISSLEYLTGIIAGVEYAVDHEQIDSLWETVRTAPHTIAARQKEFIVQLIDELLKKWEVTRCTRCR